MYRLFGFWLLELELELIQTHMAQRPMLRVEVGARLVAQSDGEEGPVRGTRIRTNTITYGTKPMLRDEVGARSRTRTNTIPYGTKANAAG